jgi:hypothetical protein
MISIFGISYPKFIVGATVVLLDHSVILQDKVIPDTVSTQSILTGHRDFTLLGKHWRFVTQLNLFRYSDPKVKYNEVKAYEGTTVDELYRRSDGLPFKDSASVPVKFRIVSINEGYLARTPDYKPMIEIIFESIEYVDITKSVV